MWKEIDGINWHPKCVLMKFNQLYWYKEIECEGQANIHELYDATKTLVTFIAYGRIWLLLNKKNHFVAKVIKIQWKRYEITMINEALCGQISILLYHL